MLTIFGAIGGLILAPFAGGLCASSGTFLAARQASHAPPASKMKSR